MNSKRAVSMIIILACFNVCPAQQNWISRISGTSNNLKTINKCSNLFIAVGDSGTIISSSDCIVWKALSSGTKNSLNGVCWGNNQYVAVGDSGTIIISSDGLSWKKAVSGTSKNLVSIAWGTMFLALTANDSGAILTSSNGVVWNSQLLPEATYTSYISVLYENAKYLLAGNDADPTGPMSGSIKIFTSSSGSTWSTKKLMMDSYSRLKALIWGENEFMAFSYNSMPVIPFCKTAVSTDGDLWTIRTTGSVDSCYPINCVALAWGEPGYLAVGPANKTIFSPNGVTWRNLSNDIPEPGGIRSQLQSLLWDGEKYAGVGEHGTICTSVPGTLVRKNGNKTLSSTIDGVISIANNSIFYRVVKASQVKISIYDLQGKFLQKIVDCYQSAGFYKVTVTSSGIAGSYVVSMKTSTYYRVFKTTVH